MSRYIDAEKLKNKINAYVITTQDVAFIKQLIDETEPADVAPVVRCGRCMYVDTKSCPFYYSGLGYTDDDYCSYGIEKCGGEL